MFNILCDIIGFFLIIWLISSVWSFIKRIFGGGNAHLTDISQEDNEQSTLTSNTHWTRVQVYDTDWWKARDGEWEFMIKASDGHGIVKLYKHIYRSNQAEHDKYYYGIHSGDTINVEYQINNEGYYNIVDFS